MKARSERVRRDRLRDWSGAYNAGLEEWIAFLHDIATSKASSYVGVLLHHYSGLIDNERFELRGRRSIKISEATPDYFAQFEEDVVYMFNV